MSKRDFFATSAFAALLGVGGMVPGAAFAQSATSAEVASPGAGDGALGEVIVTARRREERLQDVPASIAAATGVALADRNIVSVTELDQFAPGLTFVTNPNRFGSGPGITLRGVSTQTQGAGVQDSVAMVVDGVVLERAKAGAFPDLNDVERVEVLRGPQGTLFGKNASAGVISITTKDPSKMFSAMVDADYSTFDTRNVFGAVSGPIIDDRLYGRISAFSKTRHGYVENVFDGSDWEGDDQFGVRGKLLFTPSPVDEIRLGVDYVLQRNDAGANVPRAFLPVTDAYIRDALAGIIGPENDRINAKSLGEKREDAGGLSLQWDRSLGDYTLTALTSWRASNQKFHAGTYTWLTPLNDGDQLGFVDQDQFSGELRLASPADGRVTYVGGLFLLRNRNETGVADPATLNVLTGARSTARQVSVIKTWNAAAFFEADAHLTDQLTVTAGARWTYDEVDMTVTGLPATPGLARFRHPLGVTADRTTSDKLTWRLGAQWRPNDNHMLWVSAATGYKAAGFNQNTSTLGDSQEVAPETSTSYEAGFKSQLLDRRLTFNFTLFHSEFKDFQTQGTFALPGVIGAPIILLNADSLETQGFEAELNAQIGEGTQIAANATYIDATYKRFSNAPCYGQQNTFEPGTCVNGSQDLSGDRLPSTPKWAFNLYGRHEFAPLSFGWRPFVSGDVSYRTDIQWNVLGSPLGIEDGYTLVGASFGFISPDRRATVRVYGKNLTDQFYTSGIQVGAIATQFLPPDYRRVVGVTVNYAF